MNVFTKVLHILREKEKELHVNIFAKAYHALKKLRASSQEQEVHEETPRAVARVPQGYGVPREVARVPTKAEVLPGVARPSGYIERQPAQIEVASSDPIRTPTAQEVISRDGDFF
jgi:hypothetical protein